MRAGNGRVGGFVVLCLFVVGLAGCTEQSLSPKSTCTEQQTCPAPVSTAEAAAGWQSNRSDLPFPNATLPMLQLVDCWVQTFFIQVPATNLRPFVPEAFELLPGLAPHMASVVTWLHVCDRTLDDHSVFGKAQILWTLVHVEPVNTSWTDGQHISNYMLTAAADVPGLVESLENRSVESQNATFESFTTPDVAGHRIQQWTVQTETSKFLLETPITKTDPRNGKIELYLWTGSGSFQRSILSKTYLELAYLIPGLFVMQGPGPLHDAMTIPATPSLGSTMEQFTLTLQFDSEWM